MAQYGEISFISMQNGFEFLKDDHQIRLTSKNLFLMFTNFLFCWNMILDFIVFELLTRLLLQSAYYLHLCMEFV